MRRRFAIALLTILGLLELTAPVQAERPPISDPQASVRVFPTVTYLGEISDEVAVISANGRWVAYSKEDGSLAVWSSATNSFTSFEAQGFPAGVSDNGQWVLYQSVLGRDLTVLSWIPLLGFPPGCLALIPSALARPCPLMDKSEPGTKAHLGSSS